MKKITITLQNIVSILWQDIINFLHLFDGIPKNQPQREMVKKLKKEGILFFENFVDRNQCELLKQKILQIVDENPSSVKIENGTFFNYRSENKPEGPDYGMLDIMKVNHSVKEIDKIDLNFIKVLLEDAHKQKVLPGTVNAYVNKGVKGTRGYHIDNTQPVAYKAFLYLTEVEDKTFGPYSFVNGSQKFSPYVYLNLLRNLFITKFKSTDMPLFNKSRVTDCIGKRGTLILSNQNGIHRGHPQDPDKTRVAIVFTFIIVSKLNYLHKSAKKNISYSKAITNRS